MHVRKHQRLLRGGLLLLTLWCGGCTGMQEPVAPPPHAFDKTEVDLELGRPEAAARYQRPRGAQLYTSDGTEIDLTQPRTTPAAEDSRSGTPTPSTTPPKAPLPGGDR